jgi:hypothetical protein
MSKSKKTAKAQLARTDVKHGAIAVVSNPPLLTASQIDKDCPVLVQDLSKRIAVHYEKLVQCEGKAEQHKIAIGKLLIQAKEACDTGGFTAFRERFCPNLGRSRAHELLLIASGKKTIEETKAATRERVKKHRAVKKAASSKVSAPSVTVMDDPTASAEKRNAEYADPPKINGKFAAEPKVEPAIPKPEAEAEVQRLDALEVPFKFLLPFTAAERVAVKRSTRVFQFVLAINRTTEIPPKRFAMIDLDENQWAEIEQIVEEVAQEVADRAADEVAKKGAGSPDDTFIIRRFARTVPDDPEMKAAWEEAISIADQTASEVAEEVAERTAKEAPSTAYERICLRAH